MQLVDLTKPSDNYKVITFPDGEVHLELSELNRKEPVNVRCRITNATDLFIFMQLADILKRQCIEVKTLEILYLMGMRCDRLFDINRPFTLGIVANVINSMGAERVVVFEPHSERAISMINNAVAGDVSSELAADLFDRDDKLLFVAPDKGALKRYNHAFAVICSKVRDEATGKLLGFKSEEVIPVKDRDLLMIDDLCDGGGTFVGLAPEVRKFEPKSLSLLVTHAVQWDGIVRVSEVYDHVYITNTYKKWGKYELPSNVTVIDVNDYKF